MQYEIRGETLPVVICRLDAGEKMVTEGGGMSLDVSEYDDGDDDERGRQGKAFGRNVCG